VEGGPEALELQAFLLPSAGANRATGSAKSLALNDGRRLCDETLEGARCGSSASVGHENTELAAALKLLLELAPGFRLWPVSVGARDGSPASLMLREGCGLLKEALDGALCGSGTWMPAMDVTHVGVLADPFRLLGKSATGSRLRTASLGAKGGCSSPASLTPSEGLRLFDDALDGALCGWGRQALCSEGRVACSMAAEMLVGGRLELTIAGKSGGLELNISLRGHSSGDHGGSGDDAWVLEGARWEYRVGLRMHIDSDGATIPSPASLTLTEGRRLSNEAVEGESSGGEWSGSGALMSPMGVDRIVLRGAAE